MLDRLAVRLVQLHGLRVGLDPRSVVPRPDSVVGADVDPLLLVVVVVAVRVRAADGAEGVLHRAGRAGFE